MKRKTRRDGSLIRAAGVSLFCLVLSSGCGNTPAPTRFINFDHLTCGDTQLGVKLDASVVSDPQAAGQAALLVEVCVSCSGEPVDSIVGMQGRFEDVPPDTPSILTGPFGLPATNEEGCSSIGFRAIPAEFVGKTLRVDIADANGVVAHQVTTIVRDDR